MTLDFRKMGFSAASENFPLSDNGSGFVAHYNGLSINMMPPEFGYASNAYMQSWMNALGDRMAAGLPVKHAIADRLLLPSEIVE